MKKIIRWSNSNSGFLTLIGIVIAVIIALLSSDKIHWSDATSILSKIVTILSYKLQLPVYLLFIIIIVFAIYFYRIKTTYKRSNIDFNFLVGRWLNEWDIDGPHAGEEELEIREDGGYYRNNEHIFDVIDFKYDHKSNQILFTKSSVRIGDDRRVKNVLDVNNNNSLSGKESDYNIRYTRID